MTVELYRFDGVLWDDTISPYCPKHRLEMDPYYLTDDPQKEQKYLQCEECPDQYVIPRDLFYEKKYIRRKLYAKNIKSLKVLNLDDEAIPIAEDKIISRDNKFFVKALLTESKIGKRLVIYAGEKGGKEKTQIFVEPKLKRLTFDQNDLHPNDIFLEVQAKFMDGSTHKINKQIIKEN